MAGRLSREPPETEFDRGLRRFGAFLTIAMLVLVIVVFVAHMLRGRPPVETLLFAVALAVGLSPELLPAILSVNLARGARMMARHGVIVRHLNAIENLGSMDVLCTDKTGTLTEGVVELAGGYDPRGASIAARPGPRGLERGPGGGSRATPWTTRSCKRTPPDLSRVRKVAEIPFDFVRKRVSVVRGHERRDPPDHEGRLRATCSRPARAGETGRALDAAARAALVARHDGWTSQGIRVLAVATRDRRGAAELPAGTRSATSPSRDSSPSWIGRRRAPPVPSADLAALGVTVKLITGDSRLVAQHVAAPRGPAARAGAHRGRPGGAPRRGPRARGGPYGPVRGGRSGAEGAHHPGPEAARATSWASWATA